MKEIRVMIVDDHAVVRKGVEMIISDAPLMELVGEADNGRSAIEQIEKLQPDVILMDLVMSQGDGLDAIAEIKHNHPQIKILVLTMYEDNLRISAALEAGADGYLLKQGDGEGAITCHHKSSAWRDAPSPACCPPVG